MADEPLESGGKTPASERRAALQLLLRAALPEIGLLKGALPWLVIAAALEALGPVLGKAFIDRHLLPRDADMPAIVGLLGGALVTGWLASALRYVQLVRLAGLAMRSVQRIRESVYAHVLRLPMRYFDGAITGQLVSRVTNDTEAVKSLYVQVLFVMLDSVITLLGMLAVMAWLDWRLMQLQQLESLEDSAGRQRARLGTPLPHTAAAHRRQGVSSRRSAGRSGRMRR